MTKAAVFTQGDISKVLKGAKAAGMVVTRIEIDHTGKIVARFDHGPDLSGPDNEWDAVFDEREKRAS